MIGSNNDVDERRRSCQTDGDTGFVVTNAFNGYFTYWRYRRVAAKVRCS